LVNQRRLPRFCSAPIAQLPFRQWPMVRSGGRPVASLGLAP
jgi:hypothetical protein